MFSDLEHYAVSMKKVTSESVTFADLMENLLVAQLSDLEKVLSFVLLMIYPILNTVLIRELMRFIKFYSLS